MSTFALNESFTLLCARVMAEKPASVRLCKSVYKSPVVQVESGVVSLQGCHREWTTGSLCRVQ